MRSECEKLDDGDSDSLDQLLASARWPQPAPEQVERLKRRWFLLRRGRGGASGSLLAVAALAAGLLVATATAGWRWIAVDNGNPLRERPERQTSNPPLPSRENRGEGSLATDAFARLTPDRPRSLPKPEEPASVPQVEVSPSSNAAGALSRYEQVASWAALRRGELARTAQRRRRRQAALDEQPLRDALDPLVAEAKAELSRSGPRTEPPPQTSLAWRALAASAAAKLQPQPERYEPALWKILIVDAAHGGAPAEASARRLAAARLLSQLSTPRSSVVLRELAAAPDCRAAAIVGLARVADESLCLELIDSEPQPELQRLLLSSLLGRGDDAAVRSFLEFVDDPAWTALALAAARETARPPVDSLFAVLEGPQVSLREAAAKTLGNLADPSVPQGLAQHVVNNVSRREALVGLLFSYSPASASFLRSARQDLYLAATVQAVESDLWSPYEYPRR
jgi:hypothetical protein